MSVSRSALEARRGRAAWRTSVRRLPECRPALARPGHRRPVGRGSSRHWTARDGRAPVSGSASRQLDAWCSLSEGCLAGEQASATIGAERHAPASRLQPINLLGRETQRQVLKPLRSRASVEGHLQTGSRLHGPGLPGRSPRSSSKRSNHARCQIARSTLLRPGTLGRPVEAYADRIVIRQGGEPSPNLSGA